MSNAELGFDYLRDQLAMAPGDLVLPARADGAADAPPFYYCVVDEADSILIDEARTPLIISETTDAPAGKYEAARDLAEGVLASGVHYDVDAKTKAVTMTEAGYAECEAVLGKTLFDPRDPWAPFVFGALRAKEALLKDRDYLVQGDRVALVDAFSGRVLEGRRYTDGLQQSVEAKERVAISAQTRPSAVVSFQALFRLVATRLAGTTRRGNQNVRDTFDAVPTWNGSLVREIESQRLPEIVEAETSTRSRGTRSGKTSL